MKFHEWFAASLVVLVGSVAFLSLFSYAGSMAHETFWQDERLERETQIAGVDVSEMSEDEAVTAVQAELDQWKENSEVALVWYDEKLEVSNDVFTFDVDDSVERMFAGEGRTEGLSVQVNEQQIRTLLNEFTFSEYTEGKTDVDMLTADLGERVSQLPVEELHKNVHDYLLDDVKPDETVIASASRTAAAGTGGLATVVEIPAESAFSFLEAIGEPGDSPEAAAETAAAASAVFEVLLHTNFELLERTQRHELPDGVPLGYDAAIVPGERDLVFYNPNAHAYELELFEQNNRIEATLYGIPLPYDIRVTVEEVAEVEPKTRVRFSSSRSEGDRAVISEGSAGHQVRTVRHTSLTETGDVDAQEEIVAEDYYPPENRLEEWSTAERHKAEEEEEFPEDGDWNGQDPGDGWNGWDQNGDGSQDGQNGWDQNGDGSQDGQNGWDQNRDGSQDGQNGWDQNGEGSQDGQNGWDQNGDGSQDGQNGWNQDGNGQHDWDQNGNGSWQDGNNQWDDDGEGGQNGSGWPPSGDQDNGSGQPPGSTVPGQNDDRNGNGHGQPGSGTGPGGQTPPADDDEEEPIKGY
ncbi:VanW family protein [Alteribacter natronophilus]|uniref:VanW family protein n=1 Tax=Alteribacter natronophilus TaxID=2583810 RepID=UPI00110F487F|nr:VanW family protein [Alteribacter natronophilus]TMW71599.1 hypothetical protein FGB90_11235 [Alteribacter natronophilus]